MVLSNCGPGDSTSNTLSARSCRSAATSLLITTRKYEVLVGLEAKAFAVLHWLPRSTGWMH
jgi:hypothetical protein